jgi:hypothetical protein
MKQEREQSHHDPTCWEGRDELNLAEFPIALLSSRADSRLKTIQFEDRVWDRSRDGWVSRRLTISASDRYGLPTALDDEVVLGLIQLTRESGFESHRVFFSRYRLLQTLGWRHEGKSYNRLETSLRRWLGVTLFYENAWWDKGAQSWVDENFHILEQVSIYDRQRRLGLAGSELPLSMFAWGDVVFRSFQSGYLKQIDMELFRRLASPITKKLYRFLDKRFYHKARWEFDLRDLACEHIGLSRCYDTGQLKRRLRPAIAELEAVGYLTPEPDTTRFARIRDGHWRVSFGKAKLQRACFLAVTSEEDAKAKLLHRGVNPVTAGRLVAQFPADRIDQHVEVFDWLMRQSGQPLPQNPAGYLVESIRCGYTVPSAFPASDEDSAPAAGDSGNAPRRACPNASSAENGGVVKKHVDHYIRSLAPNVKHLLEEKALAAADPVLVGAYRRVEAEGHPILVGVYRRLILERHVAGLLERQRSGVVGSKPRRTVGQ